MSFIIQMFSYSFMVRAFIAGIIVSVLLAIIGNIVVHKRLSLVGESLSHTSLAGVSIGLVTGINPVLGAIFACLAGALVIEVIRKKIKSHSELAVAMVLSLGVGITGIMSGLVKTNTDFSSFLFGSIIAIQKWELIVIFIIGGIVLICYLIFRRAIFLISFDELSAKMLGIKVTAINILITVLIAITVALSTRIVGTLIITSLMVVPIATAMIIARSYKSQLIISIVFSLLATIVGLFVSYMSLLKPGGVICLLSVVFFFIVLAVKKCTKWQ